MSRPWLRGTANVLAVAFVACIAIVTLSAPWHTRWGSTTAELHAALPGDEPITGTATCWLRQPWRALRWHGSGCWFSSPRIS
jgi:hypothetical protein